MRAGQWDPEQKKIVINDIPKPSEAPNQFLVKIQSASLSHSDLLFDMRPDYIVTLGHEGVGYIESIGDHVPDPSFQVGDAIGFNHFTGCCFECDGCRVHNSRCETGNSQLQGFGVDGFFQEYAVVDWQNAVKLPETLDISRSAPLFCAGITAFHSVESCELNEGDWLAIIGCGGLGQYAIKYAKAMGIRTIGIDIIDDVIDLADDAGADATFNSRKNDEYVEEIKRLTGKGCHAAAVYTAANSAFSSAPHLLRTNGLLMVIGIALRGLDFVNTFDLITGRYRIKADSSGPPQRMRKAIDFTGKHCIQPEVDFRTLDDIPEMVLDMATGMAHKRQVVIFF
ncbi:hypothetical protein ACEQ8H_005763 [Pleosporales sp. CAS-2024a]